MVAASPEIASKVYDHAVLKETVDWLAIAANDYYATTTGRTGYLMPMEPTDLWDNNSVSYSEQVPRLNRPISRFKKST